MNKTIITRVFYLISTISFIISSGFFIYNLTLLNNIETVLRYIFISILIVYNIYLCYRVYKLLILRKVLKIHFLTIFLVISSIILIFVSTNINKLYSTLSKISNNTVTYSSSLIVLSDSEYTTAQDLTNQKIGIISFEENKEEYELSEDIIDNEKINAELIVYENAISMLTDLMNNEITAIFINSNYVSMYSSIEIFENIASETTVLSETKKDVEKEELFSNNIDLLNEPFTILLIGIDSTANDIHNSSAFNGDAIILLTVNPKTLNITMLSIPRDTYVPITCFKNDKENKITHAGWYGEQCMVDSVSNFTGIDIDYYVKINFKGVVNLVDSLGGINVDVPIEFCEQNSDRLFGDNLICLEKGYQQLDGEAALALSRHRSTINDIQRGLNQQLVINGLINKAATINSLDQIYSILDALALNLDTNFTTDEILSFYNIGKDLVIKLIANNETDIINIEKLYLSGYDKMIWDEDMKLTLYNYVLYPGSLAEVVEAMKINLELGSISTVKSFSYETNEVYEQLLIGQGYYTDPYFKPTVPSLIGSSKSYVEQWASANNVNVIFEEVESDQTAGIVISQSYPYGYFISNLPNKEITISISINNELDSNDDDYIYTDVPNMKGWSISAVNNWIKKYGDSIIINFIEQEAVSEDDDLLIDTVITNTKIGVDLEDVVEITITIMVTTDDHEVATPEVDTESPSPDVDEETTKPEVDTESSNLEDNSSTN